MRRVILGGIFLATLNLGVAGQALALTNSAAIAQKVHLQGYMPSVRVIYVDQQNRILSVVGNTDKNITPVVTHPSSPEQFPMDSYVKEQYKDILSANGGSLKAGVTYYPMSGNLLKLSV